MKIKYLTLGSLTILIWGLSLVATKNLLQNGFSPNIITFLRFFIASVIVHFTLKKEEKSKIAKRDYIHFLFMATGGISLFYFFENAGLIYTTVANTSLITATIPLFTLLIAAMFYDKRLVWQNILGIFMGLSGTFLLFYKDILASGVHLKGDLLIFGSVVMWIVYSFAYRKIMEKYNTNFITYIIFILGTLLLLPVVVIERNNWGQLNFNIQSVLSLFFLAVFCSYLGYYFWNIAVKNIGVKITSNLILFLPVVSITAGILIYNEPFSVNLLLSAAFITSGAYLTSLSKPENLF